MYKHKIIMLPLIVICIAGFGSLFAVTDMADDENGFRRHFKREDQRSIPFLESGNEGNETAGQMAAWLLLVSNLPVALSLLIKGTNRSVPLRTELKKALSKFNRTPKDALMWLHLYLNPSIL